MTYPRYPFYKDSGVEWLGEVPTHWDVITLRRVATYVIRKHGEDGVERQALSLSAYDGIIPKRSDDENRIRSQEELAGYMVVTPRQLVVNPMWVINGGIGVSKLEGVVSPAYRTYDISDRLNPGYLDYLVRSHGYVFEYNRHIRGTTTFDRSVRKEDFGSIAALIPSEAEQVAIAAFLDRETARVDALIAKQERLIALLGEKRQALISHAVTKGLHPDAPMQDSGVEWLGEIPAHWRAVQVRHLLDRIEQGWSPECENRMCEEHEWGILKTGCVNYGVFNEMDNKALPGVLEPRISLEVKPGDLLMNRASGSLDLIGSMAYVESCRPRLMISDKIYRLRTRGDKVDARYLAFAFGTKLVRTQIRLAISGAEGLANNISQSSVRNIYVALPPLGEQAAILADVNTHTANLDHLVVRCRQAIELLREHRTSLISAAVTGKIDVRSAVLAEASP